jgi:membrane protein DedA with SNARE-associated domain
LTRDAEHVTTKRANVLVRISELARRRRVEFATGAAILVVIAFAIWEGDVPEAFGDAARTVGQWVRHYGPLGAAAALYVEESGVPMPIPGDVFIVFIGRRMSAPVGLLTAWVGLIVVVVLGATNLYWLSRKWGRRFVLSKVAPAFHLSQARLDRAERWFQRYGPWALILGRHIPGFRIPITVTAGVLEISYPVFVASVAVSTAIWAGVFLVLGHAFGGQLIAAIRSHRLITVGVGVGVALAIAAWLLRVWSRGGRGPAATEVTTASE